MGFLDGFNVGPVYGFMPAPTRFNSTSSINLGGGSVEAYCVKCKCKQQMVDAKKVTMKNGKPATKGVCPECGTGMYKIGKK